MKYKHQRTHEIISHQQYDLLTHYEKAEYSRYDEDEVDYNSNSLLNPLSPLSPGFGDIGTSSPDFGGFDGGDGGGGGASGDF